ncbi:cobalt ABC transporter [Bifidobacterium aemilianum]|uniref:Cobalt ABC transporter n=1 Tax=Bifidobacterium aemilianum TaxID=2493120 RepID=A0A366K9G6_9BIFI|nr:energy-coupling factor transporter ATPase [Bifidobacterium aemilianum]RBP98390.1 cobalt ABC transporter [Bifidobacterium aemilianum]
MQLGSLSPTPVVALDHISFSYDSGQHWVLDDLSLTIEAGQRICLIGANGSGKSTLARIIAGLITPDRGQVNLLGHPVFDEEGPRSDQYRMARRGIGAVFQNPDDQIVTTVVEDDLAFGPENLGLDHATIGHRIVYGLDAVAMGEHRLDNPTRLSGGQQQRIAIAGMLAMSPQMLVLDEPTAMLDADAQSEVMAVLDSLQGQGTTIVLVTHKPSETLQADRIVTVEHGRLTNIANPYRPGGKAGKSQTHSPAYGPAARHDADGSLHAGAFAHAGDGLQPASASKPADHSPDLAGKGHLQAGQSPAVGQEPAIQVSHVTMSYSREDQPTLYDLSLRVARGETVALMGPNGSGKSTLARLLAALAWPDQGSISVEGISLAKPSKQDRRNLRQHVGFVMQHPERQLFAETVAQDVAYGPRNQKLDPAEVNSRVTRALAALHIEDLADRSPFSLSGGQQRLVAIAGVIACRPSLLILDEPTAGLDTMASRRIYELIELLHLQGTTIVLITHSAEEARLLADRTICLPGHDQQADGQGAGKPAEPATAAASTPQVSSYIGSMDPRVKTLGFLALMFSFFAISTPLQLGLSLVLVLGICAAARTSPVKLLVSTRVLVLLFVIMSALNLFLDHSGHILLALGPLSISSGGVQTAVIYAARLMLAIMLGALLMETTTPTQLTDAFGSLLTPFKALGLHGQELALVMSLAFRFLPTLGQEARSIIDAQSARGGSIETGSPAARLRALGAIIVPVFAGAIRHADNLSLALDARCYEQGIHRTHWRIMRVRPSDAVFVIIVAAYILALLGLKMAL